MTGESLPERTQIIRTKLHRPQVTPDLICRRRLHDCLDGGLARPLILVAAPAGYGKSMLVSHWAESLEEPCAWLSLDSTDNDLSTFLSYLIAAVRTLFPSACPETESLVRSPNLAPVEVLGSTLLNELDSIDPSFVLVLDDYHRIESSSSVNGLLMFILEHPPRSMHLAILTRRDPPLPIITLRAEHRLAEVRLQDLRFTAEESSEFIADACKLPISDEALTNLAVQTEGWIAGLRLVSLCLPDLVDPDSFLKELRGGISHTEEYLLNEVLASQPPAMQEWLLKTSILDRFCTDLCEAVCADETVTGDADADSSPFLEHLQQHNLFIIGLDYQGTWYRYHHLFQALLHRQLTKRLKPDELAVLHERASIWFEDQGLIEEAVIHALAAAGAKRAAQIVERAWRAELNADRWYVVKKWLATLPAPARQESASLLLAQAWVYYCTFQLERIPTLIDQAEPLLDKGKAAGELRAEVDFFRACLSYWEGDAESCLRHVKEAISLCGKRRGIVEGNIELYFSMARCMRGQTKLAARQIEDRLRSNDAASNMYRGHLFGGLLFNNLLAGNLNQVVANAQRMRPVTRHQNIENIDAWRTYLHACGHLHAYELPEALTLFDETAQRCYIFESQAAADSLAGLVLTQQFLGQDDRATATLDRLDGFARKLNDSRLFAVARSSRSRVDLLRGDPEPAIEWAQVGSEEVDLTDLFCWLEVPALTRARALIAAGSDESLELASALLEKVRSTSKTYHFTNQTIEAAVLQVVALERQGWTEEALAALEKALALARPGGWIRPFVEAGPTIAALLKYSGKRRKGHEFVKRVLTAFEATGATMPTATSGAESAQRADAAARTEIEALTGRELEILELVAQRLHNKEIAERLFISPHTVNDHLKHIYQKLDAHGRQQAVVRAAEAGILDLRS